MTADRKIISFGVSLRLENCLRNNNIETLEQASKLKWDEVIQWKNFGKKTANELRAVLGHNGMSLADCPIADEALIKYFMFRHKPKDVYWSIYKASKQGLTLRQLAERFGCSREAVRQHCRKVEIYIEKTGAA